MSMITCMEMKLFILKYASKIMFYDVNIACYQLPHSVNHSDLDSVFRLTSLANIREVLIG